MAGLDLSDELRAAGAAMVRELDAIELRPQGVLWLHFPHIKDWRLTVISDLVEYAGRLKIYGLIDAALEKHGPIEGLTIFDVHLASPAEILPRVIRSGVSGSGPMEVVDCFFNGVPVNALIYRLLPARPQHEIKKALNLFERTVSRLPLHA